MTNVTTNIRQKQEFLSACSNRPIQYVLAEIPPHLPAYAPDQYVVYGSSDDGCIPDIIIGIMPDNSYNEKS